MWFMLGLGTAAHPHGKDIAEPETQERAVCHAWAQVSEPASATPPCECPETATAAIPRAPVERAEPAIVAEPKPRKRAAHTARKQPRAKLADELRTAERRLHKRVQSVCGAHVPAGETRTVVVTLAVDFKWNVVNASVVARKPGAVERCVLREVDAQIARGWGALQAERTSTVRYNLRGRPKAAGRR